MEWLINLAKEWLSPVADLLSLITFAISIYVAFAVKKVKSNYLFRARAPEIMKELAKQSTALLALIQEGKYSSNDTTVLLGETEVTLKSLKKKVSWAQGRPITKAKKMISKVSKDGSVDNVWDVYTEIQKVIAELNHILKDNKWEK